MSTDYLISLLWMENISNTSLALKGPKRAVGARLWMVGRSHYSGWRGNYERGMCSSLGGRHQWFSTFHKLTVLFPAAIRWHCWCIPNCMSCYTKNASILFVSRHTFRFKLPKVSRIENKAWGFNLSENDVRIYHLGHVWLSSYSSSSLTNRA